MRVVKLNATQSVVCTVLRNICPEFILHLYSQGIISRPSHGALIRSLCCGCPSHGANFKKRFNCVKVVMFGAVIFEYNRRLYSQGGLAGNDCGFEQSICASRGLAASKRH